MNNKKLIIPKRIVTVDKDDLILHNTAVEIIDNRITSFIPIEKINRQEFEGEIYDYSDLTLIPGFVQTHVHLCQTLFRGLADDLQLLDWLQKKIFPKAKGKLSSADLKALQAKTRYIDDPLFGSAVETQYRRLGRNVQAGVGSLAADLLSREITGIETAIDGTSGVVAKVRSLRDGLAQVNKVAFERNKTTVRQHLGREDEVSALQLPNALFRNHQQYMKDSFEQVKTIFSDRTRDH